MIDINGTERKQKWIGLLTATIGVSHRSDRDIIGECDDCGSQKGIWQQSCTLLHGVDASEHNSTQNTPQSEIKKGCWYLVAEHLNIEISIMAVLNTTTQSKNIP